MMANWILIVVLLHEANVMVSSEVIRPCVGTEGVSGVCVHLCIYMYVHVHVHVTLCPRTFLSLFPGEV